jgi:hypothetical protein
MSIVDDDGSKGTVLLLPETGEPSLCFDDDVPKSSRKYCTI